MVPASVMTRERFGWAILAENLEKPGLPPGPQVQVVLQEQAEQLAGIDLKSRLQVGV